MSGRSQAKKLLERFIRRGKLSALDMTQLPPRGLGIQSYARRISDLRQLGYKIESHDQHINGKLVSFYYFMGKPGETYE